MHREVKPEIHLPKGARKLVADLQDMCELAGTKHMNGNLTAIYVEAEAIRNQDTILMCGLLWHAPSEQAAQEIYKRVRASQFAHADYYRKIYRPIRRESI